MQTMRGNRAALYTRVSTEEQAEEGFSLDAQMRRLEKYCESEGYEIAGRYAEQGHSGRNTNRPEYKRMMSEMDKWDFVLVLKMDRIHRNSVNFTNMMRDLEKNEKDFCSVQEQFDTKTAMGRFVMDFIQRIAQLESEQIGERVKIGMDRKAKLGKGLLGFAHPYGYEYSNGELKVKNEEMYTVRAIYNMYRKEYSMEYIANSLNEAEIPSKKGGKWSKQTISYILHNPLYVGYLRWGDNLVRGDHAAIVDYDVYKSINQDIEI